MYLDKFVHSKTGKIIMSLLLGIGLATFFRAICKGEHCKIIQAPPINEIEDQIYKFNDKCYKIEKNVTKCNINKQTIKIA